MSRFPVLATVAVLSAPILAFAACGDDGGSTEVVGTTVAGATELEVEAFDFGFEPSAIELEAGEPVNLTMRVTDGGHNLVIEGTGFSLPIKDEPDSAVGTVVIDDPGEYVLVCTVPGHAQEGMVGTVTVR